MKSWFVTISLIIGIFFATILSITQVNAESLSVSLRVGDTRVSFDGYSSPNAFITIKQNGVVIGTTTSDSNGFFSKTLDADNPGIQTFELYSTDTLSRNTITISYNLNLTANTLTSVSNIVFPPTFTLTDLSLTGLASPLSQITIMISDGSNINIPVLPDGSWNYAIGIQTPGDYTATLISTIPGGYISLATDIFSFSIISLASPTSSSLNTVSSSSPNTSYSSSSPTTATSIPKVVKGPKKGSDAKESQSEINYISTQLEIYYTIAKSILNINLLILILIIGALILLMSKRKK